MKARTNTPQEQKIIQATINYFRRYPHLRGINKTSGSCYYVTDDGYRCAVGKWMTGKVVANKLFVNELNVTGDLQQIYNDTDVNCDVEDMRERNIPDYIRKFDDILIEDAKGLDQSFWLRLQMWHDGKDNWGSMGLTTEGYTDAIALGWIDPRKEGKRDQEGL